MIVQRRKRTELVVAKVTAKLTQSFDATNQLIEKQKLEDTHVADREVEENVKMPAKQGDSVLHHEDNSAHGVHIEHESFDHCCYPDCILSFHPVEVPIMIHVKGHVKRSKISSHTQCCLVGIQLID